MDARIVVTKVYPRAYGGNGEIGIHDFRGEGLSPRIRGKRRKPTRRRASRRSIPAHTGETHSTHLFTGLLRVYPRAYGGN